jgi:hypothetical protein
MKRRIFDLQLLEIPSLSEECISTYSGVTRLLSREVTKIIAEWKERVGEEEALQIMEHSQDRGTKLHKLVENYVNNKTDIFEENSDMLSASLFGSLKPIIDSKLGIVYGSELGVYSHILKLKGTIDIIAEWEGELAIIDIKTKDKMFREIYMKNYFLQCCIYAIMIKELVGLDVKKMVVLGGVEYKSPQLFTKKISKHWYNQVDKLVDRHKDYINTYHRI